MENVGEDIVAVVWGVVEEFVDGSQLLARAVCGLSVPGVQGEQPADVFERCPIVCGDEHPRGRAFTNFLKSLKIKIYQINQLKFHFIM